MDSPLIRKNSDAISQCLFFGLSTKFLDSNRFIKYMSEDLLSIQLILLSRYFPLNKELKVAKDVSSDKKPSLFNGLNICTSNHLSSYTIFDLNAFIVSFTLCHLEC